MDSLLIPNENDFRRWIKEAMKECLENSPGQNGLLPDQSLEEPLLSRKEIAGLFRISLVTLHDWMKRGLPSHKQRGRVYFLRKEVMDYLKKTRKESFEKTD